MTQEEQTDAFATELDTLIHRYRCEFNLTVASVIGALELAKMDIYQFDVAEAQKDNDE